MSAGKVVLLTAEPFFGEMLATVVREDGHEVELVATFEEALHQSSGWAEVVVVEALGRAEMVRDWLDALGAAGARVALVYGRDTAEYQYHPAVAYAMFAQASLEALRGFIVRSSAPRIPRTGMSSGVQLRQGVTASDARMPAVEHRRRR